MALKIQPILFFQQQFYVMLYASCMKIKKPLSVYNSESGLLPVGPPGLPDVFRKYSALSGQASRPGCDPIKKAAKSGFLLGGPTWARTRDPLIMSQVL